jgi:predicted TIM-barrel fold metal-dependent hydrolase
VGWIPFILEALDYEMNENAPQELAQLKKAPSEYFRSNFYATFWFENNRNKLPELIEAVGEDCILFETDFPHPTCLYPNPLQTVEKKMATLAPDVQRKIYGENARKLYRL